MMRFIGAFLAVLSAFLMLDQYLGDGLDLFEMEFGWFAILTGVVLYGAGAIVAKLNRAFADRPPSTEGIGGPVGRERWR